MIKVYVDLIKKGLKTMDNVPATWKEGVRAALEGDGWTEQDDGSWKPAED